MQDAFEPCVWFLVVPVLIFIAIGVSGILSDAPEALSVTACFSCSKRFDLLSSRNVRHSASHPGRGWVGTTEQRAVRL